MNLYEEIPFDQLVEQIKQIKAELLRRTIEYSQEENKIKLSDIMIQVPKKSIQIILPNLFRYIENEFGVKKETLISKTRKRKIVTMRHVVIYSILINGSKNISLKAIGKIFGGRDHSTMIHSKNKIIDFLDIEDEEITKKVESISNEVKRLLNQLNKINDEKGIEEKEM